MSRGVNKIPKGKAPPRKKPEEDKGYFEILSKAVFNSGFSYQVVNAKWKGTREVFKNSFAVKDFQEFEVKLKD